jgi:hypothetical protein
MLSFLEDYHSRRTIFSFSYARRRNCIMTISKINGSKEIIIELAFAQGWVESLAEVQEDQMSLPYNM